MSAIEIIVACVATLILLILSAFFSGSETSLTAITRARIHTLVKQGNKRAQMVALLRKDKERLIGTILLGNNLVNIGASALMTAVSMELFGLEGVAYATIVLTILVLVFAEVLPKTYAIQYTDKMALGVAPVFYVLVKIASPLTSVIFSIIDFLFKKLGLNESSNAIVSASEAIRGAIDLHHEQGEVVKHDRDMLGGVLDLDDLTVADVMVHRRHMMTLDAGIDPKKLIEEMTHSPFTRVPIWQDADDNIIGILHSKDVLRAIQQQSGETSREVLLSYVMEPWFIPDSTSLKDQLHAFKGRRSHIAVVVDEYGTLEGIVTLEDILEEIVGDIDDEYDSNIPGIRAHRDGFVVNGAVTIRDMNRYAEWNLPDNDAATIAGLLMHEARVIPEQGDNYIFHNIRFEVLHKDKNRITKLFLQKITTPAQGKDNS